MLRYAAGLHHPECGIYLDMLHDYFWMASGFCKYADSST